MSATIIPPDHLRERREIKRLEAAVKASNNVIRIGSNADFRPKDYIWPREQSREMKSAEIIPIQPVRGWGLQALNFLGWTALLAAIACCLLW